LRQQRLHGFDALTAFEVDAQVQDVARLFVDHRFGQAKARDLRADEAAGLGLAVEHRHVVAQRRQVARHRQRRRPGADAGHALAVLLLGGAGHALAHTVLHVGRHALEAADGHRLRVLRIGFLHPAAPAGGLAGPVAGAPRMPGNTLDTQLTM
jgi:hypothetical protein